MVCRSVLEGDGAATDAAFACDARHLAKITPQPAHSGPSDWRGCPQAGHEESEASPIAEVYPRNVARAMDVLPGHARVFRISRIEMERLRTDPLRLPPPLARGRRLASSALAGQPSGPAQFHARSAQPRTQGAARYPEALGYRIVGHALADAEPKNRPVLLA